MLSPKVPPKVKSPASPGSPQSANAVINRLDGKGSFTFEVPPQVLRWSYKNTFNALAVLRTGQPLVNYQYSEGALSLSTCYFWEVDLTALRDLMKPDGTDGEPPICSFMWGDIVLTRVYVASLDITESSRTDKTLEAEGSLTLVFAPEPVNPPKLPPIITLTNREVDALQTAVAEVAKKDPKVQAKLGGKPIVNEKGEIEVLGKVKASVTDILKRGDKLISGKLSESKEKLIKGATSGKPKESQQNTKGYLLILMENIFALLKQGSQAYNQTASTAGKLPFTSVAPVTEVLPNGQVSVAASEYGGISTTPPLYRACPTFGLTFPSPRIGDTVVYSYLDGDPNQGVYWGHLQNNLNPPGLTDRFSYVLGNSIVVIQESQIDIQCTKCNLQVTEEKITASVGEVSLEVNETGVLVKIGDNEIALGENGLSLSSGVGTFAINGSSLDITGFTSVTIAGKQVATVGATSALQTLTGRGW